MIGGGRSSGFCASSRRRMRPRCSAALTAGMDTDITSAISQRVAEHVLEDDTASFHSLQLHEHSQAGGSGLALGDFVGEIRKLKGFIRQLTKLSRLPRPPSKKVHGRVVSNAKEPGFRMSD